MGEVKLLMEQHAVGQQFFLRKRSSKQDDAYIVNLIKRNLTSLGYPSTTTEEKIVQSLKPGSEIFLFETAQGIPMGFISWSYEKEMVYIDICVIEEAYRDKGMVTAAIEPIKLFMKEKGIYKAQLTVDRKNEKAFRLYERIGFKIKHKNVLTGKILMEMQVER